MNATKFCAALLLAGAFACTAQAQQTIWCAPALQRPLGTAPDACGPGFYTINPYGQYYGPNYYLYPWFPPESGIGLDQALTGKMPIPKGGPGGGPGYGGGGGPGYGPKGGPGYGPGYPYGTGQGQPNPMYAQGKMPPQGAYPYGMMPPGMGTPPGVGFPPGMGTPPNMAVPPGMAMPPNMATPGMMPGLPGMATPGTQGSLPNLPYPPSLPNPGPPYQEPGKQPPVFVTHPWTRSPRDFFMWNEVVEDQAKRFKLPTVVP